MIRPRFLFTSLIALALGTAIPAGGADGRAAFQQENRAENLKALFERIHRKVHLERDPAQATALFRSLIPDEARAKKALREGVAPETFRQIVEQHKKLSGVRDADVVKLARPEQTVVQLHAATTEELAKYEEGSVAYREFPGGAKQLAEMILRPGVTFYEVEFLAPGKDAGMKYHLCYWDGTQWSLLGPMWRVLK